MVPGQPELAEIEPKATGDLPIPYAGPYEDHADGDRFRLCRVRASGTSAEMAPRNREPRRTPLSNPFGAKMARTTAERASDADTLEKEDSRSLARDARASGE